MSSETVKSVLDDWLEEESARSQATKQLAQIAAAHPDLVIQVADRLRKAEASRDQPSLELQYIPSKEPAFSSPTAAVRDWLRKNGPGTSGEITRDLINRIETESDNPEAVIHSTIASLKRRSKLVVRVNKEGKFVYSLPEEDEDED
jgi:phage gpG-like protein